MWQKFMGDVSPKEVLIFSFFAIIFIFAVQAIIDWTFDKPFEEQQREVEDFRTEQIDQMFKEARERAVD